MKNNILYIFIILILLIYFIFGSNGLLKYNDLLEIKESYERQIVELEEKINDLEKRIELLKRDKDYLEETIKKELNMAKPNEDLYIILDDNETDSNGNN
ncbi:septum formation initiator family protein [Deferribacterales bacterium Es71-Z0220]|uniref:FtsB family cell division protein n=1 Tax=Deferrivibrio essentukiensis TaxID=2880922 RepID=UPI001F621E14|nr:septum formation initiator family protein [Deferrivibrio essentukiensis]MCB4204200.1 septum formation initiator family protein [Deferrivibrio essentukiensis]